MPDSSMYETLKQTALGHIKAYEDPHPWDPDEVWKYRTEDCMHYLHPVDTLPAPFDVGLKKEDFFNALHFFRSVMDSTRFDIKDVTVDVENRTVVVRMTGIFDLKAVGDQPAVKGWQAEYMWLAEMEESGQKVKRVEEYMDNERLMTEVKPLAEKLAQLQAQENESGKS